MNPSPSRDSQAHTHLRWGWSGLLFFSLLGIALEVLLAWKAPCLIDASQSERRLLLRLGHAHGTLLSLVQFAFCATLPYLGAATGRTELASRCLRGALLLLPAGFLLGGLSASEGDPGLPIALVPLGALFLVAGVSILTLELFRARPSDRS
jgi:hypothetical protein